MQSINEKLKTENIRKLLSANDDVYTTIKKGARVYRIQEAKHKEHIFYNAHSEGRYADPHKKIGTIYVAGSSAAAVCECFQFGEYNDYSPIAISLIEKSSFFELEIVRDIRLVDAGALACLAHIPLSEIVRKKGSHAEGYKITQRLSGAIMRAGLDVDGIIYPSRAYPKTDITGNCIVFFDGRGEQLREVLNCPLSDADICNGKTAAEFLTDRGVPLE